MELFKLFGRVMIDNDEANKSLQKTETVGEKVGRTLGSGIKTAAKFGATLVAAGGVAVGAMIGLVNKVGQTADRLLDLEAITGMTVDAIQRWEHVAKIAGVSTEAVTNASQKLTKQLDAMSSETNKGNEALAKLGYSLDEISAMDADTRMEVLIDALAGVENTTERAKLGTDIFGGSWKEIAPIVSMGADAIDEAQNSVSKVFSKEDLERANEMRIRFDVMKERVTFLAMEFGIILLPYLEKFFKWIDRNMPQIEAFLKKAFEVAAEAISWTWDKLDNYLIPALIAMYEWVQPKLPAIQRTFEDVFGAIKVSIGFVVDSVKTAIEWFQKLFNAIKDYRRESEKVDKSGGWSARNLDNNFSFADGSSWTPHAIGLDYVPYDGYKAILHRGEKVMTAAENQEENQTASQRGTINNYFPIENMIVRNDNDIKQIARELHALQQQAARGVGIA